MYQCGSCGIRSVVGLRQQEDALRRRVVDRSGRDSDVGREVTAANRRRRPRRPEVARPLLSRPWRCPARKRHCFPSRQSRCRRPRAAGRRPARPRLRRTVCRNSRMRPTTAKARSRRLSHPVRSESWAMVPTSATAVPLTDSPANASDAVSRAPRRPGTRTLPGRSCGHGRRRCRRGGAPPIRSLRRRPRKWPDKYPSFCLITHG